MSGQAIDSASRSLNFGVTGALENGLSGSVQPLLQTNAGLSIHALEDPRIDVCFPETDTSPKELWIKALDGAVR